MKKNKKTNSHGRVDLSITLANSMVIGRCGRCYKVTFPSLFRPRRRMSGVQRLISCRLQFSYLFHVDYQLRIRIDVLEVSESPVSIVWLLKSVRVRCWLKTNSSWHTLRRSVALHRVIILGLYCRSQIEVLLTS